MTYKSKIYYITDCPDGYCDLVKGETKMKTVKTTPRRVCKEHGGFLVQRKRACNNPDCGKIFYAGISAQMSMLCIPCREKVKKLKNLIVHASPENKIKHEVKVEKIYGRYGSEKKKSNKIVIDGRNNNENRMGCSKFDSFCKTCIMPYFKCKMFKTLVV